MSQNRHIAKKTQESPRLKLTIAAAVHPVTICAHSKNFTVLLFIINIYMKKPTHEVEVDVLPTMRKMASVIREELQDMELDDHTQLALSSNSCEVWNFTISWNYQQRRNSRSSTTYYIKS